ncbi:cold-shock protein [Marinilabilia salmonicolor]|jgi:cold shock CspA family protein|uniref:Putative cold-shock DNA-binding protein n=1 Tax=Marinilabilia salmonicolor TaxID=989 RepID=A0A2T0XMS3_9BACT|nr:cold shock domain-containing protein [Marinilabilia salmonicolor]PRZ00226.1 putative cold-shock DNA-binding protein [Marinilabilia salmonicolor]RCW38291.1 putative cold-shock DNA-binding protein [Marinilabilia salmonicolor]
MGRSQESFNKKEVRNKKEKKRKEKEQKRLARKEGDKSGNLDDMIAYVDEHGNITSTPPDPTKKKEEIDVDDIQISVPKKSEQEEEDPVRKGTVNAFFDSKGFGFIKDIETKESVFFHVSNVVDDVIEGNLVSYEVEMGPKGPVAVNVKQIK